MAGNGALLSVARVAPASRTVIACALLPRDRARIVDAIRGRATLESVDNFTALRALLRARLQPVDCIVLAMRDSTGSDALDTVREIVAHRARVAIVAYCNAGSQYSADIRALAGAGVHQFLFAGIDDSGVALRAVLEAARHHCAAENVTRALSPIVPASLHSMLEISLYRPDRAATVSQLADSAGVTRGTIFNRCKQAWSIGPEEFLTWARLALAAHFLETTGCTIETIARELSFASDVSFRNTMKRYCGLRASDVRTSGGVQCVVAALKRRLGLAANADSSLLA